MYFIFLLAALSVAGLGILMRKRISGLGNALIVVGCLGCVGAFGWLVRSTVFPPEPQMPARDHQELGFVLASHAQAAVAGRKGSVVLVMPRAFNSETADSYASSFLGPFLRGHPEWDPQFSTVDIPKGTKPGTIPAETFKEVTARFPSAMAFVSFAGTPLGLETIFPPNAMPPIFVYDAASTTNWVEALSQRQIRLVIVPRPDVDPSTKESIVGMPGEGFSQLYYLAAPQNALAIAAKLAATRPRGTD